MRPTVDTYKMLEAETGLFSGVTPKKEFVKDVFGGHYETTSVPDYYYAPDTHFGS